MRENRALYAHILGKSMGALGVIYNAGIMITVLHVLSGVFSAQGLLWCEIMAFCSLQGGRR